MGASLLALAKSIYYEKPGNSEKNLNGTVHPGGNVPEKQ